MNERIRFDPAAAVHAGKLDAEGLLVAIASMTEDDSPASLLNDALSEIIGLAVENRLDESHARLMAFCEVVGPELAGKAGKPFDAEQRAVEAAIYTCARVSAGRIIAAHPEDEDAITTLAELQMAVRAMEPKFTDTEGGEL
jgi:hypothetical protein